MGGEKQERLLRRYSAPERKSSSKMRDNKRKQTTSAYKNACLNFWL